MFPMNQNAQDLMMNAPSEVSNDQLKELNISLKMKKSNIAGVRAKAEILDAAVAEANIHGWQWITREGIAKRLGVAEGGITYHYSTMVQLKRAVMGAATSSFADTAQPARRELRGAMSAWLAGARSSYVVVCFHVECGLCASNCT